MALGILQWIRIVLGLVYLLFLPGFVLSFFLIKKKTIVSVERMTISIALSCTVVPLIIFYGYKIGLPMNTFYISLEILFVLIVSSLGLLIKRLIRKKNDTTQYEDPYHND